MKLIAPPGQSLSADQIRAAVEQSCDELDYRNQRVLLIVPDATRTAPVGVMFKEIHRRLSGIAQKLDVMIALGTHSPMSEEAICERLEITLEERRSAYGSVQLLNHEWNNPSALHQLGVIGAKTIHELSEGRFSMDVEVKINRLIFNYDRLLIVGPVFPHEAVGFSGGNKYMFPGIAGPEILNFFHWLAGVVTNVRVIGNKKTPVRRVVDQAGSMVPVAKRCFCLVVDGAQFAGLFYGTPEAAWEDAVDLSRQRHIIYKEKPFHTILSCAPKMYDDLWVGGKCMYKLEPVLADGGELIIYAPHIHCISEVHGKLIEEVGYHCRDYFLKQWDRFKHYPWSILAHSTYVHGVGTFENGVEKPRARVTLATGIPESVCRKINLGYRDPNSIRQAEYAGRESEGILLVPKAGEMLFKLSQ